MELFFIPLLIFFSIIFIIYHFQNDKIVIRKLKNTRCRSLFEFKDTEYGKIVGLVKPIGEPLIAPLSRKECVYFQIIIKEKFIIEKNNWKKIYEYKNDSKFLISEMGNHAIIKSNNQKSYLTKKSDYNVSTFSDPTKEIINFAKLHNIKITYLHGLTRRLIFTESIIETNEKLAVYGMGNWVNGSELNIDSKYGKILTIQSLNNIPIFLSDDPKTFN